MTNNLFVDLATTPELRSFRDQATGWLAANLTDVVRFTGLWDPTGASGNAFEIRRQWQRRLHEAGWSGVHWPQEHGGKGASLVENAIWLMACADAGAPEPAGAIGLNMVGPTLIQHASPQQRVHLQAILSADEIWCQLFSEPEAGSDLGNIQTRALRRPDGSWLVNGQKIWISWGQLSDHGLLLARTGGSRFHGLSCFVVDMGSAGVSVRPIVQMTGESYFSEVFLDDLVLPPDALVGPLDGGWGVATSTLVHERTTAILSRHSAVAAAASELLELAHHVGGARRDEAMRLWIEAQLLRLNGVRGVVIAVSDGKTPTVSYTQRLQWGLTHRAILNWGSLFVGPTGTLIEDVAGWPSLSCASRGWTIGGGTSEVQRTMLAEKILGLPHP